jgi:hypothetical protein
MRNWRRWGREWREEYLSEEKNSKISERSDWNKSRRELTRDILRLQQFSGWIGTVFSWAWSSKCDDANDRERQAWELKETNREESLKELTVSEFPSLRSSPIRVSPSYRVFSSSHWSTPASTELIRSPFQTISSEFDFDLSLSNSGS